VHNLLLAKLLFVAITCLVSVIIAWIAHESAKRSGKRGNAPLLCAAGAFLGTATLGLATGNFLFST
jgi:hypothetical protein